MRAYTHTQTCTHTHTCTHTRTNTCTHTHTNMHTHKHTHTHIHTHSITHSHNQLEYLKKWVLRVRDDLKDVCVSLSLLVGWWLWGLPLNTLYMCVFFGLLCVCAHLSGCIEWCMRWCVGLGVCVYLHISVCVCMFVPLCTYLLFVYMHGQWKLGSSKDFNFEGKVDSAVSVSLHNYSIVLYRSGPSVYLVHGYSLWVQIVQLHVSLFTGLLKSCQ